jgi:nucleoside 2-deoxyribosyltransferase
MQPFDGGKFDKRFEEVFAPAIKAAGLDPYRVDKDPGVEIPINDIEKGIREASICFADITTDNPNVWFELGYAISANKPVVLVCSAERAGKFPFDIQHRKIIGYGSDSRSDFDALEGKIKERIGAILEKAETLQVISSNKELAPVEGLSQQELIVMAAVAGNLDHPNDTVVVESLKKDVTSSGFTRMAFSLGLKGLMEKGFLTYERVEDFDREWWGYRLSPEGWAWIMKNQARFTLRVEPQPDVLF